MGHDHCCCFSSAKSALQSRMSASGNGSMLPGSPSAPTRSRCDWPKAGFQQDILKALLDSPRPPSAPLLFHRALGAAEKHVLVPSCPQSEAEIPPTAPELYLVIAAAHSIQSGYIQRPCGKLMVSFVEPREDFCYKTLLLSSWNSRGPDLTLLWEKTRARK